MQRNKFFFACCLLCAVALAFSTCKEENLETTYKGMVVNLVNNQPFPNLEVKVTDGEHINTTVHTDETGFFSILVKYNEINSSYYILIGDTSCVPVKREFKGFGKSEIDLGTIEVEGPKAPTVETVAATDMTAFTAVAGGNVTDDGRASVTRRGVVYSTEEYPSLEKGKATTNGNGKGEFQSALSELERNTTYYYRAYAVNRIGTSYGEQMSFATTSGEAEVLTDSVYAITAVSAKCAGTVVNDGGYAVTARGVCWSKTANPTITDDIANEGGGKGSFACALRDLEADATYYVRAFATNEAGTVYGEQIKIQTLDGMAVVKIGEVADITATEASVNATVVSDCDIRVTARGVCWSTKQYPTIEDAHTTTGKGLGAFTSNLSDLEYDQQYYVRAYATNETGTAYSEQIKFVTKDGLPSVTTANVTNISAVRATCGGEVTDDGTLTVTACGVCYGTSQKPTIEGAHTKDGKGLGTFTSNLKDLKDKTTYYVRAYATTDAGTTYGEQRTFKTENGIPVVELAELGVPTANSITCKGEVTGDGGVTVSERGFCYSTSQYPSNTDAHVAVGDGIGEFNGTLTGLEINTKYYVRAYAINSLGVGYSEQQTFTTQNGLATVTTGQPIATATTITAGGEITGNGGYAVTERGVCYSTTNSEPSITDEKVVGGKGNGTFNVSIAGLSAATTYYLRAYATNENGTAYGEASTIVTKNGAATATAGEIISITALTASGSVTVTDAGGATLQECGICWATTPNPTIENSKVTGGNQLNTAYTCNMTELAPNTTYYVRAWATTDITTSYSEQVTFKTQDGAAKVVAGYKNITALTATGSVTVTDAGGATLQECGICWATTQNPTIENSSVVGGNQLNTTYTCNMTELTPNTTYYIRAWATTDITTAYSEQMTFKTTTGLAVVVTTQPTATATSILATGEITDDGGYSVSERGICYSTTNTSPTTTDTKLTSGGGKGKFSISITELTPSTNYYLRAYAINQNGTSYGDIRTVTTKNGAATAIIEAVTDITALTASCKIKVTDADGATLQKCGICWSTSPNPTTDNNNIEGGNQLNTTYTCNLVSLSPNTTYYVRAYATTDITTTYSESKTFTTSTGLPSVSTTAATNVKASTAVLGGNVIDNGGYTLSARGVCWSSTTTTPTITDSHTSEVVAVGSFSSQLTGLSANTTYFVRAYATNTIGTSYGETVSFTTQNGLPTVITSAVGDNYTETTIVAGGQVTDDGESTVTERGVCYSIFPYPDLSMANTYKVVSGNGLGYYSSNITGIDLTNNTYYIRAFATNANGTAYGEQVIVTPEMLEYKELPTIEYGGYIYRLYHDIGSMTWKEAETACENLVFGGYDDWMLPETKELLTHIMTNEKDGWYTESGYIWVTGNGTPSSFY